LSADIKELQELIERERTAEEKVSKAKEEAQAIVKQAREKAESIMGTVENDPSLEKLRQARQLEIVRKKTEIEEDHKRKASALEKDAQSNFEKAVELLLKETLSGKL
jgi:V/A-type H+-transporting ATPase subunit G/H